MFNAKKDFYSEEISDSLFKQMWGKSFKEDCRIPRADLRHVHVLYCDLTGETHTGELVCSKFIAEDVLDIFAKLYAAKYPLERVELIDKYAADDEASMAHNNCSSFNYRLVSFTTRVSKHGLGMAVDINPLYNPYIKTVDGKLVIAPSNSVPYADRTKQWPYKIEPGDLCCQLFAEHGFEWGGDWEASKDYQHFELPTEKIQEYYPWYTKTDK